MSGGPKTDKGKAIAKMNATAHGLRALVPVIPGEDAGVWEAHRGEIVDALAAVGAMETALAERIALLLWRMGRVARYETTMVAASVADTERDFAEEEERKQRYQTSSRYIPNTLAECRAEIRDATANARLLKRLDSVRGGETIPGTDAGQMLSAAGKSATYRANSEDFDPYEVDYPDLPEGCDWDDLPTITITALRRCFAALATAAKSEASDLIEATAYHFECEARGAKIRLEEIQRVLMRNAMARTMLPNDQLDKVQRYETHLHRQMVQTLHELEAMQERRKGKSTPLARLDVSGLDAMG